jgi:hypothetical protein
MIKNLFVIAGASFVLAAVCFGGAAALGGPHLFDRHWDGDWSIKFKDGDQISHIHTDDDDGGAGGAAVSKDIAWNGGDGLDVDIPANVQFTQAPGPAKLTISGPKNLVDAVELSGTRLRYSDDDDSSDTRINAVLTAPNVHRFAIDGDASLAIAGYAQDDLDVDVSGHGDVIAKGKAKSAHINISGDGDVNLGGLTLDAADADISGSGRASMAPASAADLRISGSGEIDLLSHPAKLTSDVSGSGRIVEGAPGPASNAPG